MSRRHIALLVSGLTALLLACSGSNVTPTTEQTATPESSPTSQVPPTPTPSSTPQPTATLSPSPSPSPSPTQPPSTPAPTATAPPQPQFSFQPAACEFASDPEVAAYLLPHAECGYLSVPENRSDPESRQINLHVTIFKSVSANPQPDPVVYLAGGPGQGAVGSISFDPSLGGYADFLANRDLVVMDQRGTGYSDPDLRCPELDEIDGDLFGELEDDLLEAGLEALGQCKGRLEADGVALSAYNSAENAADFADLRAALGYEEWNLLGVSYGTRLAQTIVRDHPEGIRSIIFDSAYPIEADLYESSIANTDRVLTALDDECSLPGGPCAGRPDGFKQTLLDLALALDEEPATITITDYETGEASEIPLTGGVLVDAVFGGLYSTEIIPHLPDMVFAAAEGDYGMLEWLIAALQSDDSVSVGMNLAVQCSEEVPFTDFAAMALHAGSYPELSQIFGPEALGEELQPTCDAWVTGSPAPIENEPVTNGSIPVLVLAGGLDPITPPSWGEMISENFSESSFLEFRGIGHAVTFGSQCGRDVVTQFLTTPETLPQASALCVADLPGVQFAQPLTDITLESAEDISILGLEGLKPEGWTFNEELFAYQHSELGLHVLLLQAVAMEQEMFLSVYFDSLGLEEMPEPVGTQVEDNATWTLFEFTQQGLVVNLAVGELANGALGVVLTTAIPDTHDLIYDEVFLPAMLSLQPEE